MAGERPAISILIISYNTRDTTIAAIASVLKHTHAPDIEIIVVDNASPDDSADAIAERFPEIPLIRLDNNVGFARANNIAAKHARGEYILLLNPDTLVEDDAINALYDFARREPDAKIWGGRTLYEDRSLNPSSCWGFLSIRALFFQMLGLTILFPKSAFFSPETYGRWKRDSERRVDIVTGCFLLIERAFWEELGGFDPRYFMYAEEADLSQRAQYRGAKPMITPTATIVHLESKSDPIRLEKTIKVLRGKTTFVRIHWKGLRLRLGLGLLKLSPAFRSGVYRIASLLTRSSGAKEKASFWRSIYDRRSEWIEGYPPYDWPEQPARMAG